MSSDRQMCQNVSDAKVYKEKDHLKKIHYEALEYDLRFCKVVAQVGR